MKEYTILGVEYRGKVLFVAADYPNDGYWQAYVGALRGYSRQSDIENVVEWGARLGWTEAKAFFPDFDIVRYKTFQEESSKNEYI